MASLHVKEAKVVHLMPILQIMQIEKINELRGIRWLGSSESLFLRQHNLVWAGLTISW